MRAALLARREDRFSPRGHAIPGWSPPGPGCSHYIVSKIAFRVEQRHNLAGLPDHEGRLHKSMQ
jgi:hypothetical protein